MSLTNSNPLAAGSGSRRKNTCPYWPRPPDCLAYLYSCSTVLRIVSRYATCGWPTSASTLNSRSILSTMISRWSSPIPLMIVWPLSSSVPTLKLGSSWASFWSAIAIFSWSALVFGSTATLITGSGKSIFSRITLSFSLASVSPVRVFFRPTTAPISPAWRTEISSRLFECIFSKRPILSLLSWTVL